MFVNFFFELKNVGVPVSLKEYLTLMDAMKAGVAGYRVEDFYYLSRAALVKDERNLDLLDDVHPVDRFVWSEFEVNEILFPRCNLYIDRLQARS